MSLATEKKEEQFNPTYGPVISGIGSILILLGGISAVLASQNPELWSETLPDTLPEGITVEMLTQLLLVLGILGIICGILVLTGAVLFYKGYKIGGGVLTILFSLLSFFSGGGSLFIPFLGLILGVIGGILGIANI